MAAGQSVRRPREERGLGVGVTRPNLLFEHRLSRVGSTRVEKTRIEGGAEVHRKGNVVHYYGGRDADLMRRTLQV